MNNHDHHAHQHESSVEPAPAQQVDHAQMDHSGHAMPASEPDAHAVHVMPITHPDAHAGHAMPAGEHAGHTMPAAEHAGHADHSEHAEIFRRRFWISFLLSIPVVLYSEMVQDWLGFSMPDFPGSGAI